MARGKSGDKHLISLIEAEVTEQPITETIESNYMPYVMSVIVSRAIPSIDGFKPSHRKLLYTMYKMGLLAGQRTKSANVVGQTMKLNPHGDAAIYETMVRLTRGNEALLHPFIDSKGSFGKQYSRDMAFAASRYTEVKLDSFAAELFDGIDRNAVDMIPNYDNTMLEPAMLPTTFPNILVSPNIGIAVGMACSICSFNLSEICDGTIALLRNPDTSIEKMLDIIKAPDFPGGGQIVYDRDTMREIYTTGSGSVRIRARYRYDREQNAIDILQIPYSTCIESIIKKITDLVKEGKIRSIVDVRDAIDLSGFKLTIDLRKGTDPENLMAKLFKLTPLEDTFDCNFNILIADTPMQLGVVDILKHWIDFRMVCLRRELEFNLAKKSEKLHLLIGLATLLLDIDKAIRIIRSTEKEADVVPRLMEAYFITEKQAEYIAEIKLRHLNREYILNRTTEIESLQEEIAEISSTIKDDLKMKALIASQLQAIKKKYGKPRKTQLINATEIVELDPEDLIDSFMVQVVVTREGYFKKLPKANNRQDDHKLKEGDEILYSALADNTSTLFIFTNHGNLYKVKLSDFELAKASAIGEYLPAICQMEEGELPQALVTVKGSEKHHTGKFVFIYENGKGVRIPIKTFDIQSRRQKLSQAVATKSPLVHVCVEEEGDILLVSNNGKAVVISPSLIPKATGKGAAGVQLLTQKAAAKIIAVSHDQALWEAYLPKIKKTDVPSAGVTFVLDEN